MTSLIHTLCRYQVNWGFVYMGLFDHMSWIITLTMITLSGFHCTNSFNFSIQQKNTYFWIVEFQMGTFSFRKSSQPITAFYPMVKQWRNHSPVKNSERKSRRIKIELLFYIIYRNNGQKASIQAYFHLTTNA